MKLVRLGANPNTKDQNDKSLLDRLTIHNKNGRADAAIEELITVYHADTTIMITPLECMLNGDWEFSSQTAMKLVSQGADPNTRNDEGKSLLHKLVVRKEDGKNTSFIEELANIYHVNIDIKDKAGRSFCYY